MRSTLALLLLGGSAVCSAAFSPGPSPSPAVGYFKTVAAKVPLHVVQADLMRKDVHLGIVTTSQGIGHWEGWSAMIDRSRPAAAITGTYFDTRSGLPTGSLGFLGQMLHRGPIGTAFLFDRIAGPSIRAAKPDRIFDFGDAETYVRAGPRLITNGKTTLYPRAEGFRDPAIYRRNPRTAIGYTKSGKLIFAATAKPVLLREMAAALKGIGMVEAMCLDGGSSSALFFRGKTLVTPRRSLTNILVVYDEEARYQERVARLNPAFALLAG